MANNTLAKNIAQAATDFADIKTAIIDKGVNVPGGTPTAEYDDLIRQISDVDLSNVVKYDSNRDVNLTGEGDVIVDNGKGLKNNTGGNLIKSQAPAVAGTSLADLPVGYNLRGKTIRITNTNLSYGVSNSIAGILGTNGLYIYIQASDGFQASGDGFSKVLHFSGGEWLATELTIPDNMDYIIESNTLSEVLFTGDWNVSYAVVDRIEAGITVGDKTLHTQIDSVDNPTWESSGGRKTFAMVEDLPDPDLTNVVKFDDHRNVNLSGEGDLILDSNRQIYSNIGRIAATIDEQTDTTLNVIPVGFNFRGKMLTISNSSTDFHPYIAAELAGSNGLSIILGRDTFTVDYDGVSVVLFSTSGWENNAVVFPDDKDYIVAFNELNAIDFGGDWNIQDAIVSSNSSYSVLLGDINVPTKIDSSVRPTWGDRGFAMLDEIAGSGGAGVTVFTVQDANFYGFEFEEIISADEFNKIVTAYNSGNIVLFKLVNTSLHTVEYVVALSVLHPEDGANDLYQIRCISWNPADGKKYEIFINMQTMPGTLDYYRWYYAYERNDVKTPLINALNQNQAGIGALDAALGQRIVNTDEEQGVTGLKIFDQLPQSDATPKTEWDMTTKRYVDNLQPVILTQAEYDALGAAVEFNGITYYITPNPAYPGEVDTAPEPTDPAVNVKKVYSTKYGSAGSIDFPDWGGGVTVGSVFDNEGKQVIKMADLGYQPVSFYGNEISNTNRTLKFYIFSAVAIPRLDVKVMGPGGLEASGGNIAVPANTWTLFSGAVPASVTTVNAIQFTIEGATKYNIYVDHIYFV